MKRARKTVVAIGAWSAVMIGGAAAGETDAPPPAEKPAALEVSRAPGDEKGALIRAIVKRHLKGVYVAKAMISATMNAPQGPVTREFPVEFPVAVVDASDGLLVGSNPEEMVGGFVRNPTAKDFKVLLPDGKELPAHIEANDSESGLAYFKLDEGQKAVEAVSLADIAEIDLGDEAVSLRRISGNHPEPVAFLHRVAAVLMKPRTALMLDHNPPLGTLMFALDGRLIGVTARIRETGEGGRQNVVQIVLPASQIISAVRGMKAQEEGK